LHTQARHSSLLTINYEEGDVVFASSADIHPRRTNGFLARRRKAAWSVDTGAGAGVAAGSGIGITVSDCGWCCTDDDDGGGNEAETGNDNEDVDVVGMTVMVAVYVNVEVDDMESVVASAGKDEAEMGVDSAAAEAAGEEADGIYVVKLTMLWTVMVV
jgi:hypothetical protein